MVKGLFQLDKTLGRYLLVLPACLAMATINLSVLLSLITTKEVWLTGYCPTKSESAVKETLEVK